MVDRISKKKERKKLIRDIFFELFFDFFNFFFPVALLDSLSTRKVLERDFFFFLTRKAEFGIVSHVFFFMFFLFSFFGFCLVAEKIKEIEWSFNY